MLVGSDEKSGDRLFNQLEINALSNWGSKDDVAQLRFQLFPDRCRADVAILVSDAGEWHACDDLSHSLALAILSPRLDNGDNVFGPRPRNERVAGPGVDL